MARLVFGPSQSIDVRFAASPLMDALCAVCDEKAVGDGTAAEPPATARTGEPPASATPRIPRQGGARPPQPVLHRGAVAFRCRDGDDGHGSSRSPLRRSLRSQARTEEDTWRLHSGLLQADLTYRMGQLAAGGLAAALADLAPAVTVLDRSLLVQIRCEPPEALSCSSGLVLMPRSFSDEVLVLESPATSETVLFYPARGIPARHRLSGEARRSLRRRLEHTPLPQLRDLHALRTLTTGDNLSAWRRTDLVEFLTGVACQACGCR